MHGDGYRGNGGIGFALEEPKGILTFSVSEHFEFNDRRKFPLSKSEIDQLEITLQETKISLKLKTNVSVTLEGEMFTHYGMGSGTGITLACLEGLLTINNKISNKHDLISYSKRGGTSGIGIHTYFDGGFVFDLGARNRATDLLPSSRVQNPELPLLLDAIDMPDWKIGLCLGQNLRTKTQEEEVEFFKRTCPIRTQESHKVLYHILFGTYASLREANIETFANSIKEIQTCEWKKKERAEHGEPLLKLERKLYQLGAICVGMSSLGPLLFFLSHDGNLKNIAEGMKEQDCDFIFTSCSNSGRQLTT